MRPYEIFLRMAPSQALDIFSFMQEQKKSLFNSLVETFANQKKLRPVFVERKSRDEKFAWMKAIMGTKANDALAAHTLQIWLLGMHSPLLCDFLDGLGIKHDEDGTLDELPLSPPKAELEKVIDSLLEKYEPATVSLYLQIFQGVAGEDGWPPLDELLENEERLPKLGAV